MTAGDDGTWSGRRRAPPGAQPVQRDGHRPGHGQAVRADRSPWSSTCRSRRSSRPTLTIDQPADGASFENGAILVSGTATNATQVTVSATYLGAGRRPRQATTPPNAAAPPADRRTVAGDGTFSVPVRPDRRALDGHDRRLGRRGQGDVARPARSPSPTRASTWSSRSRVAGLDQGLGGRRARPDDRGGRAGPRRTARS